RASVIATMEWASRAALYWASSWRGMGPVLHGPSGLGESGAATLCRQRNGKFLPIRGGGLAHDGMKQPVEMRERLETNLEGDLTHAQIGIRQQRLGALDAETPHVFGEVQARVPLEEFANVKGACAGRLRHIREPDLLLEMLVDKCFGAHHGHRLGIGPPDGNRVALAREILGEAAEDAGDGKELVA